MNLNFSDLIRYFLSSIVIAKSWEFHTKGEITEAMENEELFFYLAVGIISYNIYRSLLYENIFANLQDVIFTVLKKVNKNWVNYRHFLKKELNISKKDGKKLFNIINREYISKMKSSGDFITASSIHFFYMSSLIFLVFMFLNLFTPKFFPFTIMALVALLIGVISDMSYEQKELSLIKELLKSDKKKQVEEIVKKQL